MCSIEERSRSFDLICSDLRFDALRYTVTDYLEVEGYEVTDDSTEEIAARHIGALLTNPQIVIAAVAVEPRVVAAIRHFISLGFISQPYKVFPTMAEARAWIAAELRRRTG